MAILRKRAVNQDVWSLGLERMRYIYDKYDHVCVSFSGGKDSTATLHVALEVAKECKRLPLDVVFVDEEAIHPETIEYVTRVRARPDVNLRWYCLPVQHRNACSRKSPYWYPWAKEDQWRWCREMPPWAITEDMVPGWVRRPMPQCNPYFFDPSMGMVAMCLGIRASESLRRYRSVAMKTLENFVCVDGADVKKQITLAKPIYDWATEDVWTAPHKFGWDYNRAYDAMTLAGISRTDQRVSPPYGEEPLRGLWQYAQCWPDLWDRMTKRVPGAATAGRYSRSPMYGFGQRESKPFGMTWEEAIKQKIEQWAPSVQAQIAARLNEEMQAHYTRSNYARIPEEQPHPASGCCWQHLYMLAVRGDLKKRRLAADKIATKGNDDVTTRY